MDKEKSKFRIMDSKTTTMKTMKTMTLQEMYDLFGLEKNKCTLKDIKRVYYELALLVHPDRNQGVTKEEMLVVVNAYHTLCKDCERNMKTKEIMECKEVQELRDLQVKMTSEIDAYVKDLPSFMDVFIETHEDVEKYNKKWESMYSKSGNLPGGVIPMAFTSGYDMAPSEYSLENLEYCVDYEKLTAHNEERVRNPFIDEENQHERNERNDPNVPNNAYTTPLVQLKEMKEEECRDIMDVGDIEKTSTYSYLEDLEKMIDGEEVIPETFNIENGGDYGEMFGKPELLVDRFSEQIIAKFETLKKNQNDGNTDVSKMFENEIQERKFN